MMKTAVICFEEDRKDWVGHLSRCVVGCTPGICFWSQANFRGT